MVCDGAATFTDCTLTGNSATDVGGGLSVGSGLGGREEGGTITLTNSTVSNNTAGSSGGGLYIAGGGFGAASLGIATLSNSTVSNNTAGNNGGGLDIEAGGTATLSNSTLSGNSATSSLSEGGGVFNVGTATLTNCTVAGDVAARGGGFYSAWPSSTEFGGSTTLTNCTVSANSASIVGGGMYVAPLNGLTFVTLTNTIVAEQVAGGGIFLFQPTNVIGSYDVFSAAVSTSTTHSIVADPMLAPLGDYGGPTQTMALLPGSPAIDAGLNGTGIPTTDQRGTARDAEPDIGAFEVSAATSLAVAGFPSPTTAGVAQSFTVTALDAYGNVATDYTGTASFTSSDGQAVLPAKYTFTSAIGGDIGVHTFAAALETAGTQSITAADTVNAGIAGTQSGITVSPAAASTLAVSGFPSPATAGVAGLVHRHRLRRLWQSSPPAYSGTSTSAAATRRPSSG